MRSVIVELWAFQDGKKRRVKTERTMKPTLMKSSTTVRTMWSG